MTMQPATSCHAARLALEAEIDERIELIRGE